MQLFLSSLLTVEFHLQTVLRTVKPKRCLSKVNQVYAQVFSAWASCQVCDCTKDSCDSFKELQ